MLTDGASWNDGSRIEVSVVRSCTGVVAGCARTLPGPEADVGTGAKTVEGSNSFQAGALSDKKLAGGPSNDGGKAERAGVIDAFLGGGGGRRVTNLGVPTVR